MKDILTSDLAHFGSRERKMTEDLLKAWREQGLPDDFNNDEDIKVWLNTNSGCVFLSNSDYQVAMLTDDDKLESFYSCPQCGHEGFKADMAHGEDNKDCQEYLKDIGLVTEEA